VHCITHHLIAVVLHHLGACGATLHELSARAATLGGRGYDGFATTRAESVCLDTHEVIPGAGMTCQQRGVDPQELFCADEVR
jgi:hypothetical protein